MDTAMKWFPDFMRGKISDGPSGQKLESDKLSDSVKTTDNDNGKKKNRRQRKYPEASITGFQG